MIYASISVLMWWWFPVKPIVAARLYSSVLSLQLSADFAPKMSRYDQTFMPSLRRAVGPTPLTATTLRCHKLGRLPTIGELSSNGSVTREAVDEAALAKLQSASDTYVVDRRGDPNNLTYGSLHRYSIPPYHRIGFGRVLGLSSSYRINSSASSESNLVLDNQTTRVRPERGLLKRQRDTRKLRLIRPGQGDSTSTPDESFIALGPSRKRKTIDDAESDDPYHTVLFADISGVLEVVPQTHDSRSIIEGFLCFFGMPPLHECDHYASSWRLDTCLRDTGPQDLKGLPNYRTTTSNLFSSAFADFPCQGMYKEFVQRALSTLVQLYALDESFAVYHFAYEYHLNPATAYTATRKLLKDRPSSLRLYNACALIEAGRGRGERANHIWRTAIGMSARKFMPDGDAGALFLWRNWIWNSLRTGDRKTALSQVLSIGSDPPDAALPEEDQSSAASLLRVRRVLRDGFHHSLYHGLHDEIALYAECLALLTYLTDNAQLESALRVFHRYSDHAETHASDSVARATNSPSLFGISHSSRPSRRPRPRHGRVFFNAVSAS
ncbi:hypothetical protein M8818_005864 [Zalaria obscura]|uniref:Uncharacterized protein n=1 Tax=Zalaria obscura TaxID=2024903 RepID=A0ACC3S8B6_9PEZI